MAFGRSNTKVGVENDGHEGIDTLSSQEPSAGSSSSPSVADESCLFVFIVQKYRLGRQARKETGFDGIKDGKPSKASFNSSASNTVSSGNTGGEIQLTEALRYQIEVQSRIHEQLEVQKKLQSRIEAQGKYLQAILEKAQKSLSFDTNNNKNMEAARAQLKDFNQALSGLMDNVNQFCISKGTTELDKVTANVSLNSSPTNSAFRLYQEEEESHNLKFASHRGSLLLDLNLKGNQDFFSGNIGNDLDPQMHLQIRYMRNPGAFFNLRTRSNFSSQVKHEESGTLVNLLFDFFMQWSARLRL
ncbi:hypothetical protein IEQ34_014920 [Dendrobium chrysotoxum]|uniref:MYB-CC type transcription factor LHEQLE-containing domain-containing protein n=1 Tax=Dendrobium chrysotoxum TaxID=161865 RepID=A0AAV7GMZ2_DENCH|nr:hypothetical protein IEQ34_014920 [Dendrobium chrysotoxum]